MQDSEMRKIYRNFTIGLIAIIVVVLVFFLTVVPAIEYSKLPAFLDVLVTPVDSQIVIGDTEYRNAVYEMEPGSYMATISREGFETITVELELKKGETTGLYVYLEPTDGNWGFYSEQANRNSFEALLRLKGYNSNGQVWLPKLPLNQESDYAIEATHKFTVGSIMPIDLSSCREPASRMTCNAIHVNYEYSNKCNDSLCLVIVGRSSELGEENLDDIGEELLLSGYDINDYDYIYIQDTEL